MLTIYEAIEQHQQCTLVAARQLGHSHISAIVEKWTLPLDSHILTAQRVAALLDDCAKLAAVLIDRAHVVFYSKHTLPPSLSPESGWYVLSISRNVDGWLPSRLCAECTPLSNVVFKFKFVYVRTTFSPTAPPIHPLLSAIERILARGAN